MSIVDDSAPTEHINVFSDNLKPKSHRRPPELAVSHKLETSWFLAIVAAVSSFVGALISLTYLFTWVAITNGQGGVAPGFFPIIGSFGAICTLALAIIGILYLSERFTHAPWS